MDGVGFDPTYASHWLLIGCFMGISIWGLLLSWQWQRQTKLKRERAKLARRLAMELHGIGRRDVDYSSREELRALADRSIAASDE